MSPRGLVLEIQSKQSNAGTVTYKFLCICQRAFSCAKYSVSLMCCVLIRK